MQRPELVWYWFNLIRDHTHSHTHTGESVDVKQEVRIINEGGSIIISHYIIHGGYCKDINHCCRKWLNNCHKSRLNTIRHPNSPFPINMCRNNEVFLRFLLAASGEHKPHTPVKKTSTAITVQKSCFFTDISAACFATSGLFMVHFAAQFAQDVSSLKVKTCKSVENGPMYQRAHVESRITRTWAFLSTSPGTPSNNCPPTSSF